MPGKRMRCTQRALHVLGPLSQLGLTVGPRSSPCNQPVEPNGLALGAISPTTFRPNRS